MVVTIRKPMVNEIKRQILHALRESGGHLSGERLAEGFGTSRVSIWKQIRSLRESGYGIESSRRGYRLISSPDLLLPCEFPGLEHRIRYYGEIGSTMDAAREMARQGAEQGTMVIAEAQIRGRGRLSREWLSPRGGIYFTVILRPEVTPAQAPLANLMASVAVATTIRRLYELDALVKWPNDVLICGKKVCGILAEMESGMDKVKFINIGVGVNANTAVSDFAETATSLREALGRSISRQEFVRELIAEIDRRRDSLTDASMLEEWRHLSATLNRDVRIAATDGVIEGRALDIDSTGALILRQEDGSVKKAVAGDCIQ